jgi:hypothetical protein
MAASWLGWTARGLKTDHLASERGWQLADFHRQQLVQQRLDLLTR